MKKILYIFIITSIFIQYLYCQQHRIDLSLGYQISTYDSLLFIYSEYIENQELIESIKDFISDDNYKETKRLSNKKINHYTNLPHTSLIDTVSALIRRYGENSSKIKYYKGEYWSDENKKLRHRDLAIKKLEVAKLAHAIDSSFFKHEDVYEQSTKRTPSGIFLECDAMGRNPINPFGEIIYESECFHSNFYYQYVYPTQTTQMITLSSPLFPGKTEEVESTLLGDARKKYSNDWQKYIKSKKREKELGQEIENKVNEIIKPNVDNNKDIKIILYSLYYNLYDKNQSLIMVYKDILSNSLNYKDIENPFEDSDDYIMSDYSIYNIRQIEQERAQERQIAAHHTNKQTLDKSNYKRNANTKKTITIMENFKNMVLETAQLIFYLFIIIILS